jgi:hypothetical protein
MSCQMNDFPFSSKNAELDALVSHAKWLAKRKSTSESDMALMKRLISDSELQSTLQHVIHMFPRSSPSYLCDANSGSLLSSSFTKDSFTFRLSQSYTERARSAEEARKTIQIIRRSNGYRIRRVCITGMQYPPEVIELIQLAKPTVLDITVGGVCKEDTLKNIGALINASETVKIVKIQFENQPGLQPDLSRYLHESFAFNVLYYSLYS